MIAIMTKTCLQGYQQSKTKTKSPQLHFVCSMFRSDTFQKANNKGADQSVHVQTGLLLGL